MSSQSTRKRTLKPKPVAKKPKPVAKKPKVVNKISPAIAKPKTIDIVNFKKIHPLAKTPQKAHDNDAGYDIFAIDLVHPSGEDTGRYIEISTGICMEIPNGYVGLIFPRSSISKTKHYLRNSVGVIDAGYRGEIKLRFSYDDSSTSYITGDKIAQIVFIKLPEISLKESNELSDSERSLGGFGSTGS
jgi:dUTP pyrophosphatase